MDLARVLAWGQDWIVTFNDRKTKRISVSTSEDRNFPAVPMEPQVLAFSEDLRILGMDISSDLSWGKYISGIAKSAAMRVVCLFHARKFIPPSALLYLYKNSIVYCSHIWPSAPDCYLLAGNALAVSLDSLGHRRAVGTACLFYIYVFGRCSSGISKLVPPFKISMRETRQSALAHRYILRSIHSGVIPPRRVAFSQVQQQWELSTG